MRSARAYSAPALEGYERPAPETRLPVDKLPAQDGS